MMTSSPDPSYGNTRSASEAKSGTIVEDLIAWIRDYARTRINSLLIDERRSIPPHIVLDFGNRGLLGMQVSRDHGGLGLQYVEIKRVVEELAGIDLMLAVFVGNNNFLGIRPIDRFAQASRRDALLPRLASGRSLAGFAMTEKAAGSNPRAIESTATLDADGRFHVNGTKLWIGSGSWAGVLNVFAQTVNRSGERLGITGFLIEQGMAGVRLGPEALTLGMRGMVQNTIILDDAVVEAEDVLGKVGEGLAIAQDSMVFCRMGLAAMAVGTMRRCFQLLHRYSSRRTIGTGRLLENPVTRVRLAEIAAKTLALECLVQGVASRLDSGEDVPVEPFYACKILGPEFLWQAADWLVQGLGGRGYMENNVAPRILRDARVLRIFEGPTETMQMFLGSRALSARGALADVVTAAGGDRWVFDRLGAATERLRASGLRAPFERRITSAEWKSHLLGEVFAWGLLAGAVRKGGHRLGESLGKGLALWVEQEFEDRCGRVGSGERDLARVLAAPFAEGMVGAIDDIEECLPGEDVDLDELLKPQSDSRS